MNRIVVVKVGGSLLDWVPLPARLAVFLASLGKVRPVLIVGGGPMADELRPLDRLHDLGESKSHALALRILDVTAWLLADLLPESCVVTRLDDLALAWKTGLRPVLAPRLVLDADDRHARDEALPHSWNVTTDSIAARVATLLGDAELILLKSAPAPPDLAAAVALDRLDSHFLTVSRPLSRVTYVAFRQEPPVCVELVTRLTEARESGGR